MLSFSFVIPNYNYGRFVADAVESALNLDWPHVEVVVVDDGSTDDSLEVLQRYADRITVLSQPNSGPRVACNLGYESTSGDVVVFLDADDQVEPSFARQVAEVWRPGISKVQVEMQRVDAEGTPRGGVFPDFSVTPSPSQVRHWIERTGAYPTPPGSGNAYARTFLERLFPLDDSCGDATDSACLAAAPYLGDVVTIPAPLVRYRIHENNRSKLSDAGRFTRQVERAYQRQAFALRISGARVDPRAVARPLRRGRHLLQLRIAEHRLNGGQPPIPGDSWLAQLLDTVTTVAAPGPESAGQRLLISAWSLATLLSPQPLARRLIERRFNGWSGPPLPGRRRRVSPEVASR